MIFHMSNKSIETLTIKIDNINIEKIDEFNFLGFDTTSIAKKKHIEKYQISINKMAY